MTPENAVLALHAHEHTEHKTPSSGGSVKTEDGSILDTKHTHCQTDQYFNHHFTSPEFQTFTFPDVAFVDGYAVQEGFAWQFTFPNNIALRGPPSA
ncbi:hypothetical protein [Sabulibacter ruber]|uniref:hypothetical protein n=1 Tax=Sabulibacter ruber TaxID=2811901 RepID=UPI001A95D85C|nr:hypothetical protein [Sabulibacter ruber]